MEKRITFFVFKTKGNFCKGFSLLMVLTVFFAPFALGQWNQVGQGINGEADGDISGISVALSADASTVAIGSLSNDAGGVDRGHVRVYRNNCGMWAQEGDDIDGTVNSSIYGWSVSLSADGSVVAIGDPRYDGAGSNAGLVQVYENSNGVWVQLGSDILGEAPGDYSGYFVSLSGDGLTLAVGAYLNDGSFPACGHVRVYRYINGVWTQLGADIDGEAQNDTSGESVSLSVDGTTVAIGAIGNDGTGFLQGHVRVYKYISGTWTQIGADIDGEADLDFSGKSVSLSADGSVLAVGSPFNFSGGSNGNGYVKVYKNLSGSWVQQGARIDGEADLDYSGISVSLSADGSKVAIGGYYNNGGGYWRGHVRVFKNISGTWMQQGADIDGLEDEEHSGLSVSLSADGNTVATAGPYYSAVGYIRGQTRVYSMTSGGGGSGDSDCDGVADACDMCPGGDDMMDNNGDGLADCAVLPAYNDIIDDWKCGAYKVYVAHEDDGICYTLCLSYNAAQAHLNHGDYLGPCNTAGCDNGYADNRSSDMPMEGNLHVREAEHFDAASAPLEVFPNPAKDVVEIHFTELSQMGKLTLFNSYGVKLWSDEIRPGITRIRLYTKNVITSPVNGLCFIVLQDGDQVQVKPVTLLE